MKIRALESFSGAISMRKGEIRECDNKVTLKDLLKAGYIEEVKEKKSKENELTEENEGLKKQVEELKETLNNTKKENEGLKKQIKKLENTLNSKNKKIDQSKDEPEKGVESDESK